MTVIRGVHGACRAVSTSWYAWANKSIVAANEQKKTALLCPFLKKTQQRAAFFPVGASLSCIEEMFLRTPGHSSVGLSKALERRRKGSTAHLGENVIPSTSSNRLEYPNSSDWGDTTHLPADWILKMPMVEETLNIFFWNNFQNVRSWGHTQNHPCDWFLKVPVVWKIIIISLLTGISKCPMLGRH